MKSASKTTQDLLTALQSNPALNYVEPNHTGIRVTQNTASPITPNDTSWLSQWDMSLISAPYAWPYGAGSSNVAIAIIDTGVRTTHEDLSHNIWSSPSLNFDIVINGWLEGVECPAGTQGIDVAQFYDYGYNYCSQADNDGHGTSVAGLAAARGNNGKGIAGTAWAPTIVPLSVSTIVGSGILDMASITDALEFAIMIDATTNTNIRVINGSWGCTQSNVPGDGYCPVSTTLQNELKRLASYGILFVDSAGNNSNPIGPKGASIDSTTTPFYIPASWADTAFYMPGILAVAATTLDSTEQTNTESVPLYSNYGANAVALAALGGYLSSGYVAETTTANTSDSGYTTTFTGTSAAAPHVAGAAALLASQCGTYTGMLGLKQTLINNVDVLSFLSGEVASGGRLNLYKALKSCMLQDFSLTPAGGSGTSQSFQFTFTDTSPYSVNPAPYGWQDLNVMKVFIGPSMNSQANVCYFYLQVTPSSSGTSNSGTVSLINDAGTGNQGYISIPGSGSISNSQCTLSASASYVLGTGNAVALSLSISFNSAHLSGYQIVYMDATDQNSNDSGWQSMGNWAINASSSPSLSISQSPLPNSLSQSVVLTVTDSQGTSDLTGVQFLVSPMAVNAGNSCYVKYDAGGNLIYLMSDANSSPGTGYAPGTSGATLSNSQCTVNVAGASATPSGNTITLTVPVTFDRGLQGNNIIFAAAQGTLVGNTGWLPVSSWRYTTQY